MKLNPQQKKAIQHKKGPLLIIAGAGTGKTTVITERIKYLIKKQKINPQEILALTFTEKAANEMLERLDVVMPLGYEEPWLSTFHAFCDRILKLEGLEIGLSPDYKILSQPDQWLLFKKHLFEFKLKYYLPLGNPNKFIGAILKFFSRLQDENISAEDFLTYVKNFQLGRQSPVASRQKKKLETRDWRLAASKEINRLKELAKAYQEYQQLKLKENVLDFGDLITWTLKLFRERPLVLQKYQKQFKQILVDEFQDTNFVQLQLIKVLAPAKNNLNLVVVGDDDQCLPGNSKISLSNGKRKKIRDIKVGEELLTAVGKGHVGTSKVTNVFKRTKNVKFLTFKTAGGKKIKVTDNHKMFCCVPMVVKDKEFYYVYLMHKKDLGWRLGATNDLATRLRLESPTDKIFEIKSFKTEQEAKYYEILWSLKYRIPTVCFKARQNTVIKEDLLKKLYRQLNTEKSAQKLASDLGFDLETPHYCLDAVTRGVSRRIKINFYLCYRKYVSKENKYKKILKNPSIIHLVHLETSNRKIIKNLKKKGISFKKAKKGIRVRFASSKLNVAWSFAKRLQKITNGLIESKFILGKINHQNLPALIMPASNIMFGHYLPVKRGYQIIYEKVIRIKEEGIKEKTVYDLEIDKVHNFIANDIVVHNSIYKWRGAAVSNILDFKKHYPKAAEVVLTKNYRSGQKLLNRAYRLIQNNNPDRLEKKLKIDKKLVAQRKKELPEPTVFELSTLESETEFVVKKILELVSKKPYSYQDFAILARANNHLDPFVAALRRHGIPYQLLGNRGLFDQEEVRDLIFFLRAVVEPKDSTNLFQLLGTPVFEIEPEFILNLLSESRQTKKNLWEIVLKIARTSPLSLRGAERRGNLQRSPRSFTSSSLSLRAEGLSVIKGLAMTSGGHEGLVNLVNQVKKARQRAVKEPALRILYDFIQETGCIKKFIEKESVENTLKLKNLNLFFEKIKRFEAENKGSNLIEFVDFLDLMVEAGENPAQAEIEDIDTVRLLTVHSAKGLEFPVVFLVNCVADRFPTRRRRDPIEFPEDLIKEILPKGDSHIQEERRLFYVGATRAKDYLFVIYGKDYGGVREKRASGFVEELGLPVQKSEIADSAKQLSWLEETVKAPLPKPRIIKKGVDLKYVSYSQIDVFKTCPLKYKYRYILGVPTRPHHALTFGQTIHETLRDFHRFEQKGQSADLKTLLYFYKQHFQEEGYDSEKHRKRRKKEGKKALKNYFKVYKDKFAGRPKFLEQSFKIKIGDLPLIGKIDRIDKLENGFELIDYKTGALKDQLTVDKDAQLTIYAMASNEVFNIQPEQLSLYFIEANEKVTTKRTKEQIEAKKEEIIKTIKDIKKSDFPAKPNYPFPCGYCEYSQICPFAKKS